MAKLILSLNHTFLSEYQLDKERITIGRRPTNDIHIDNLAVSGEHAAIMKMGNDFYLEDLDSTNGTLINTKATKKHLLQQGDLVELGKYQLKYINDAVFSNASIDSGETEFGKTMMIRPAEMKAIATKPLPIAPIVPISTHGSVAPFEQAASFSTAEPILIGRIQVLNGSSAGRELVLNKTLTTLGKAGVQVAVITKRPNGYFITHVEGEVFPIVSGISIGAQAFALSDHDVIELAGVKMEFYVSKS